MRSTAAIANYRNPFASVVETVIPFGGVKHAALVQLHTWERHISWLRETTDSGQQYRTMLCELFFRRQIEESNVPFLPFDRPFGTETFAAESEVLPKVEFVNSRFNI